MIENPSVYLRHVRDTDRAEFVQLMRRSKDLHAPWIMPPTNFTSFAQYIARTRTDDHEGFIVGRYSDDQIVGVINLNNVVRGSFLNASLGYYVGAPYLGKGYMAEGLELVKHYAFNTMNLHRLEANIQPNNTRSIALVQRTGFVFEGLSKNFLFIDRRWRDHERWSCTSDRETMLPISKTLERQNNTTTDK